MKRERIIFFAVVIAILVGVLVWAVVPRSQAQEVALSGEASAARPAMNLGFTYLPVTPGISKYYGLGIDSGALVTEVMPCSPAEQAGLQVGDIIVSFNGTRLDGQSSLLEMMMACPANQEIALEVCQGSNVRAVELIRAEAR